MIAYVSIWMLLYDPIWQKIPLVADLFPLPLPSGNLSYNDFITSFAIIGFFIMLYFVTSSIKHAEGLNKKGFHRG